MAGRLYLRDEDNDDGQDGGSERRHPARCCSIDLSAAAAASRRHQSSPAPQAARLPCPCFGLPPLPSVGVFVAVGDPFGPIFSGRGCSLEHDAGRGALK